MFDINDEQALAMEQGIDNVDGIILVRTNLTSVGFGAIAKAIANRKVQVKKDVTGNSITCFCVSS